MSPKPKKMKRESGKSDAIERSGVSRSAAANPTSMCHPRLTTLTCSECGGRSSWMASACSGDTTHAAARIKARRARDNGDQELLVQSRASILKTTFGLAGSPGTYATVSSPIYTPPSFSIALRERRLSRPT